MRCRVLEVVCVMTVFLLAVTLAGPQSSDWDQPVEPFRIAGNIYYVGARDLTAFLITTPEGHFLLDGGLPEMAPRVAASIEKLGFHLRDVKILLNSHAHFDHAGGLGELRKMTGAQLVVSEADAPQLERGGVGDFAFGDRFPFPGVRADRTFRDGATFTLGGTTIRAMVTPGHTRGCTTWTMDVRDAGPSYRAVFVCSITAPGFQLVDNAAWPQVAEAFEETFRRLRAEPCDIPLSSHGTFFQLLDKMERRGQGSNPFVDPEGYRHFLERMERAFREELQRQRTSGR